MYGDKMEKIRFQICEKELTYDMTSFRVQTEVSASPTFFGWVFGFNGKVQILAPESVKEQYRQMIAQADEGMQQKENKRIVN